MCPHGRGLRAIEICRVFGDSIILNYNLLFIFADYESGRSKMVIFCGRQKWITPKQSVEGTLKVPRKSLKTFLDEAHFIVNLYSFPIPPVPQANPFFPRVSILPSFQAEQLLKLPSSVGT